MLVCLSNDGLCGSLRDDLDAVGNHGLCSFALFQFPRDVKDRESVGLCGLVELDLDSCVGLNLGSERSLGAEDDTNMVG